MIRIALTAAAARRALAPRRDRSRATPRPQLNELVTVTGDLVRIGDLVENAGAAAGDRGVPRARSRPHRRGAGPTACSRRCDRHDVTGVDTDGLSEVVVTRLSRAITRQGHRGAHRPRARRPARLRRRREPRRSRSTARCAPCMSRARRHRRARRSTRLHVDPRTRPLRRRLRTARQRRGAPAAAALHRHRDRNRRNRRRCCGRSRAATCVRAADVAIERRPRARDRRRARCSSTRSSAWRPSGALRAGQVLRAADLVKARGGAAQRGRHHHLRGARHHADRARQGARRRRHRRPHQRAQRPVQPHRPGRRHRPGHASSSTANRAAHARRGRARPNHRRQPVSVTTMAFAHRSPPRRRRSAPRCSAGCSALDRLANVGEQPALSAIENPTSQPGYKPVQMPMPAPQPASYSPNSLWRNGSRAFFKDQRAHQVGDILTVKVNLTDRATIDNQTKRSRANAEDSGVDNFFGKNKLPIDQPRACRCGCSPPTPTRRATARARSTARRRCSPTSPRSSPRCCRTAISWSKASRRCASTSRSAN